MGGQCHGGADATCTDIGPFIQDDGRIHYGDDTASFALARELWPIQVIARFTVDGEPVSKSRARFTKRGSKTFAYTPEKTHEAEQVMALRFRQAAPNHRPEKDVEYGVMGIFFYSHRQRRDVDNMLKLICDGLNGVAWVDDSQVREVSGRKTRVPAKDHARTEVLIYQLGPVDKPTMPCQHCGKPMDIYESTRGVRKFCNQECHLEWRRARREQACPTCGKVFDFLHADKRIFCSLACSRDARNFIATCTECGSHFKAWKSMQGRKNIWCSDACEAQYRDRRASHCVNGHPWADFGATKSNGRRYCRECNRLRVAARKRGEKWPA
jgi:Holliday junction resolvase RusA-like endonuclease